MTNKIAPETSTQSIMGVQRAQGVQRGAAKAAAVVGGPAARVDKYTASGEQAAELMIAVLERARQENDASSADTGAFVAEELENPEAQDPLAAEELQEAPEEEDNDVAAPEKKEAAEEPGGAGGGTVKSTVEEHCFCEGAKHDKTREGSEECFVVVTAMTDAEGNPIDSPEVGQRKLLDDLE